MSRNKTLCKNERGLIEAVKKRPVLYDKLHKHYRKPLQTDHAWLSVAADVGGERVENCKKRWKSLRDTFIKYFRIELMGNVGNSDNKKQKHWIFYESLSFLKGHVELFGVNEPANASSNDPLSSENCKEEAPRSVIEVTHYQSESEEEIQEIELAEEEMESQQEVEEQYFIQTIEDDKTSEGNMQKVEYVIEKSTEKDQEYEIRRKDLNNTTQSLQIEPMPTNSGNTSLDSDEKFLLSCAPALKRMTAKQNAYIRFTIQRLLYDVEFGNSSEEDASPKKRKKHF